MVSISERYKQELNSITQEVYKGTFLFTSFRDSFSVNPQQVPQTDFDKNMTITKDKIGLLVNKLNSLNDNNILTEKDEAIVDKYIKVMALFWHLRYVMVIFVFLQQKKIEQGSQDLLKKTNELSQKNEQLASKSVENNTKTGIIQSLTEYCGIEGCSTIEAGIEKIKALVDMYKKENKELKELLQASIPLIANMNLT